MTIYIGNSNDEVLLGSANADQIYGNSGKDTLNGGLGNDTLQGDAGADTYVIAKADGQDTINNYDTDSGVDVVKFTNVASTDIKAVFNSANSLVLQYGTSSQLTITNYFTADANYRVDKFNFSNGITWTLSQLASKNNGTVNGDTLYGFNSIANTINGLAGNDVMYGGDLNDLLSGGDGNDTIIANSGADTLNGGLGNDNMQGNAGADTYVIAKADGQDYINNYDTDSSVDVVKFTNVASTDIKAVFNSANSLVLQYGTSSQLTIANYFTADANYRIDKFNFSNGVTWTLNQLAPKNNGTVNGDTLYGFNGIANTINGLGGNDVIYGGDLGDLLNGGDGNDTIIANSGADALTGGLGDDNMQGNAGADTYVIAKADGQDYINNYDTDSSVDVVKFTNVASTDIKAVFNSGHSLVLQYGVSSQLTIANYFTADVNYRIDKFNFSNGITWTLSQLASKNNGTVNGDTLYGFNGIANTINGLGGNDVIYGGDLNDLLNGDDGNDSIIAGTGNDTLMGGQGNDTLEGDGGADTYSISSLDGQDVINNYDTDNSLDVVQLSNVSLLGLNGISFAPGNSYSLVVSYGIVGSQFTVTNHFYNAAYLINELQLADGNKLKNFVVGTTANDNLSGTAGNDAISGLAGDDNLAGGAGNDLYFIDNTGDKVVEGVGNGTDTVLASVNYTLANNVENLALKTGATIGTGNGLGNEITGSAAIDTLFGLAGNDLLDGGLKGDTLNGGDGNDTFIVDNVAENIVEASNEGTDLVQSSVSFTLAANVENLTLIKASAINGTGNELDNSLLGNAAINILSGGAGNDSLDGDAGADTLKGETGDDTYLIDASDIVEEAVDAGIDTVKSGFSYLLGANLENLILTGVAASNATGNSLINSLTGNEANNALDGGAGADTMKGKSGDDSYYVDAIGDIVEELSGEGLDIVFSTIDYTLTNNVESLTLTGTAVRGTGNTLANILTGNASNNLLEGGAGADTMVGGNGNDTYVFDDAADKAIETLSAGGVDTVQSSVTYTLAANIENLTLTGTAPIKATGNGLSNILIGNSSNNVLNGGIGADTMKGGFGNDTYVVNVDTDKVEENSLQGVDIVQSSVTYTLSDNVENLTLTGLLDINATGNELNNILVGNTAANVLNGAAGADTLTGDDGADTFVFNILTGGTDKVLDFLTGTDKLQISGDINIGNDDGIVDFGAVVGDLDTLSAQAELAIFTTSVTEAIFDRVTAAAVIGNADAAYAIGDTRLFVVNNNIDTAIYQFTAADANAEVSGAELTLIGTLTGTVQTALVDFVIV